MISLIKRTKCVTTLGPASNSEEMIEKLITNGSNCVRLNFSHGNHEEHQQRIVMTRNVAKKLNLPVAIMLDTKGPEIRTHTFTNGSAQIVKDSAITIIDDREIVGNNQLFSVNYPSLAKDVKKGTILLVDDGKLQLQVISVKNHEVDVKALNSHIIKDRRALNIPNIDLSLPFVSKKDREDLIFGCQQKVDFVAVSFPCSAKNMVEIRKILDENHGKHIKLIAKIESQMAVNNFLEILDASDAIMVARGDLGVEIPFEKVPFYQNEWIKECQKVNKPVIVATQMLDSMISNPFPTRAEVTDVYSAVAQGTSVTMLSGESANGSYPDLAIGTMSKIINEAEKHYDFMAHETFVKLTNPLLINQIINALKEEKIDYIVTNDNNALIKEISNMHLPVPTFVLLEDAVIARSLALNYGLYALVVDKALTKNLSDETKLSKVIKQSYQLKNDAKLLVVDTLNDKNPLKVVTVK